MEAPPSITPAEAAACLTQAAQRYQLPDYLLWAIVSKEGGRPGTVSQNSNGTQDLGPAQINTSWRTELARYGITTHQLIWDYCANVQVAAWILAKGAALKGDWFQGVMAYHIGPNNWGDPRRLARGKAYATDVYQRWQRYLGASANASR